MVKLSIPITIKVEGLLDVTRQLKAALILRNKGRQFSHEAFLHLAAKKLNPFNQPQKPTDGDKKKKKKPAYSQEVIEQRFITIKELEEASKRIDMADDFHRRLKQRLGQE